MLIFPLKKQWYEKIKSGEKTIEYREVKPYWTTRITKYKKWYSQFLRPKDRADFIHFYNAEFNSLQCKAKCILKLGYTKTYMIATITRIEVVYGKDTDLAIEKPVYAIYLADVKECGE